MAVNRILTDLNFSTDFLLECPQAEVFFTCTSQQAVTRAIQAILLTYFRSKGLQWHTVILTTCNDGLIPHQRADVEEERRLFYVAMTRASSNLVLSHVQRVCSCKVLPSRFLYEAGLLEMPETGRKRKLAAVGSKAGAISPGVYVASAMSKAFHRPECSSVSGMRDAQLVTYATRDEAMRSGKRPCRQCKP